MQVTQPRLQVLHRAGVGEVARQFDEGALDDARPLAQVAGLQRGVLRARASASTGPRPWPRTARPGCRRPASCGIRRCRRRWTSAPSRQRTARPAANAARAACCSALSPSSSVSWPVRGREALLARQRLADRQVTVASSVRVSPLLSFQVTAILSPALAPLTVNCRNGFFATAGPHSAVSTGLAVVRGGDFLDVPGRDGLAGGVLALAGFHLVAHEDADGGVVAVRLGRGCASDLPWVFSLNPMFEFTSAGCQPPQPPSVTLTSFLA